MPINSTTAVAVPAAATDNLAVALTLQPRFLPASVTASLTVSAQRYRMGANGQPLKIGSPMQIVIGDVVQQAAKNPAFAALLTQLDAFIQAYVTANGL